MQKESRQKNISNKSKSEFAREGVEDNASINCQRESNSILPQQNLWPLAGLTLCQEGQCEQSFPTALDQQGTNDKGVDVSPRPDEKGLH